MTDGWSMSKARDEKETKDCQSRKEVELTVKLEGGVWVEGENEGYKWKIRGLGTEDGKEVG